MCWHLLLLIEPVGNRFLGSSRYSLPRLLFLLGWVTSLIRLWTAEHFSEMLNPSCSLFHFGTVFTFPCLSLTGFVKVLVWPLHFVVILYTILSYPLAAAASVSLANFPDKALLPLRELFYLWSNTLLLHVQSVWGTLDLAACLWPFSSHRFSSMHQVLPIAYLSSF